MKEGWVGQHIVWKQTRKWYQPSRHPWAIYNSPSWPAITIALEETNDRVSLWRLQIPMRDDVLLSTFYKCYVIHEREFSPLLQHMSSLHPLCSIILTNVCLSACWRNIWSFKGECCTKRGRRLRPGYPERTDPLRPPPRLLCRLDLSRPCLYVGRVQAYLLREYRWQRTHTWGLCTAHVGKAIIKGFK